MAYRRKPGGMSRSATFKEEKNPPPPDDGEWVATSSLAALNSKGEGPTYDYTSMGSSNETGSFWGVLARKAKAILEDDNINMHQQQHSNHQTREMISKKLDTPSPTYGRASEVGGVANVEYKAYESSRNNNNNNRILQIVRKGVNEEVQLPLQGNQSPLHKAAHVQSKNPTSQEDQLKAARDDIYDYYLFTSRRLRLILSYFQGQVAMATAAKAKLLLRELKTIRAELAFEKQRCCQLEEENKILRDAREEKGIHHADDDLIRRQLEALLVEKARLAHENSVYARENRVLREIVDYHQMATQDVISLDEADDEEVTAVLSSISMPDSPTSSPPPPFLFRSASAHVSLPTRD